MLLPQFQEFISQKPLIKPADKLLLAVSGGVDSMVLLNLCLVAGYKFGVAHVNFKLRGAASDADETMVIATCKAHQVECFTTNFDTQAYANENKLSIQMAARALRYNYFNTLINQHHYTKLVTAHHANDHIETFFINLLRSSGIQGLTGIPLQNENTIRPLLFATKQQIENYAQLNQIAFNTDSSNLKNDYLRNHIRHHVIPALDEASANANTQITNSIQHLKDDADLLQELHQKALEQLLSAHAHGTCINISELLTYTNAAHLLFWYLKNYGFNSAQVNTMLTAAHEESGRIFYSNTHQVLHNRAAFILSKIDPAKQAEQVLIENIHQIIDAPIQLKIELLSNQNAAYKNAKASEIYIDASKVQFPLKLRKWQTGDQMQPLGMQNQKNVSDILIDNKVDLITKANTYVLCNANNDIMWLIGQRVSETYKVDTHTKNLLHVITL